MMSHTGLHSMRSCLLYTSDAADEEDSVDLGGRRIIKKKKKNNNRKGRKRSIQPHDRATKNRKSTVTAKTETK